MKKHLTTAFLMTIATTILLGVIYPLLITALAQVLFKDKANGQIRYSNGEAIGSRIIGQSFSSAKYFHSRPSAAGNGYDAANSGADRRRREPARLLRMGGVGDDLRKWP